MKGDGRDGSMDQWRRGPRGDLGEEWASTKLPLGAGVRCRTQSHSSGPWEAVSLPLNHLLLLLQLRSKGQHSTFDSPALRLPGRG